MVLGLDFDNTLIKYDELFYAIAREKKLIPDDLPKEKNAVRDYLRKDNLENEWTIIQGEVYGDRIKEAVPYKGMLRTLLELKKRKIPINIISHKTREPYLGPKRDLHSSARNWLRANNFFSSEGLNMKKEQIFFEEDKEKKIKRILETGCTHYIDDLPEILEMLPQNIYKILFSEYGKKGSGNNWITMNSWNELLGILS